MKKYVFFGLSLSAIALVAIRNPAAAQITAPLPAPQMTETPHGGKATAIFAGGCFWGVQSVFQHVHGVIATKVGYDGGTSHTADYETVSGGGTGHAESVEVEYDPSQVSYGTLMRVFFSVALDPTQREGQFPDRGHQYRSVLFTRTPEQASEAHAYIAQLDALHVLPGPIATQVVPDQEFYPAEAEHQNFAARFPQNPYIVAYDAPRITTLRDFFTDLYRDDPVLTLAAAD